MADVAIDLFTDADLSDPVFDRIHGLDRGSHRPKIEALRRSRFARTVYLDSDIITLAPVPELFTMLTRADLIGVHENRRDGRAAPRHDPLAVAAPEMNSGVLGLRNSPQTEAFLRQWEADVLDKGAKRDQPALRRLLADTDLRVQILPLEYNLMDLRLVRGMGLGSAAPRLIHRPNLKHQSPHDPECPFVLEDHVKPQIAERLRRLLASDRTLGPAPDREALWETPRRRNLLRWFGRT